jgi:CRP-like cAMP-binding protein
MIATANRKCETCTHYNCFINRYCSDAWKPVITLNKITTDYPAGAVIFKEGDAVRGVYEIFSGKIKMVSSYGTKKERIVSLASSEQMLGYEGLGGDMFYPITAITLEETQVTLIPMDIFNKAIKANPDLAFYLVHFFADKLKEAGRMIRHDSMLMVKEKVAFALLTIINAFGFDEQDQQLLSYTPSRKDIASLADTSYETVIRVLGKLEKAAIIELKGKAIRIVDFDALKKMVGE